MTDDEVTAYFKYESSVIIYSWLKSEYPELTVNVGSLTHGPRNGFKVSNDKLVDSIVACRGKVGFTIYIRGIEVLVYIFTPNNTSKHKEVNLNDPRSIESIQALIKNLINVTLSPWYRV